jgi:hypothetical protein
MLEVLLTERKSPDAIAARVEPQRTLSEAMEGNQNASRDGNSVSNTNTVSRVIPNAEYYASVIKRDHPEIHRRMLAGEFKSVYAAAVEAGIRKQITPLDQLQKAWRKASDDERQSFLEWLGDKGTPAIRFRV